MTITIEFFGIPRERAGVAACEVEAHTLADALRATGKLYPLFATACLDDDKLQPGYLANINGTCFTNNPGTMLKEGDAVLVLSADVGG